MTAATHIASAAAKSDPSGLEPAEACSLLVGLLSFGVGTHLWQKQEDEHNLPQPAGALATTGRGRVLEPVRQTVHPVALLLGPAHRFARAGRRRPGSGRPHPSGAETARIPL